VEAAPPVLRTFGLSVAYRRRVVVNEVDLTLRRGEVVAVLGPNGAGKSTLLSALGGLLEPSAGAIECDGRVATALQSPALARRSARANVEAALAWWGVPRLERSERALAALELMGVRDLADRPARTLSGGEARRVHLARALAVAPDVLLLDEPFAGLDASTRADLLYDAQSALRSPSRGTLIVVHDRAEAWALADRVVVLLEGSVVADGNPRHLLERPPSAPVAEFLGYSGRLAEPDGSVTLVRPAQVVIDPDGPLTARVDRRVPLEDGVRLELALDRGRLAAVVPEPGPAVGADVRLSVEGGVTFDADAAPTRRARSSPTSP
jgi:ABC-type sulfate/molybdate transport systems ATPase subunit